MNFAGVSACIRMMRIRLGSQKDTPIVCVKVRSTCVGGGLLLETELAKIVAPSELDLARLSNKKVFKDGSKHRSLDLMGSIFAGSNIAGTEFYLSNAQTLPRNYSIKMRRYYLKPQFAAGSEEQYIDFCTSRVDLPVNEVSDFSLRQKDMVSVKHVLGMSAGLVTNISQLNVKGGVLGWGADRVAASKYMITYGDAYCSNMYDLHAYRPVCARWNAVTEGDGLITPLRVVAASLTQDDRQSRLQQGVGVVHCTRATDLMASSAVFSERLRALYGLCKDTVAEGCRFNCGLVATYLQQPADLMVVTESVQARKMCKIFLDEQAGDEAEAGIAVSSRGGGDSGEGGSQSSSASGFDSAQRSPFCGSRSDVYGPSGVDSLADLNGRRFNRLHNTASAYMQGDRVDATPILHSAVAAVVLNDRIYFALEWYLMYLLHCMGKAVHCAELSGTLLELSSAMQEEDAVRDVLARIGMVLGSTGSRSYKLPGSGKMYASTARKEYLVSRFSVLPVSMPQHNASSIGRLFLVLRSCKNPGSKHVGSSQVARVLPTAPPPRRKLSAAEKLPISALTMCTGLPPLPQTSGGPVKRQALQVPVKRAPTMKRDTGISYGAKARGGL
eukprot:GHVQ01037384.1.p1 GENE.GHVQ01037384.1~~GHVQ01037384.1.p1  ORF type:complete len:718 (+),score=68.92 GHVQ01037384.1:317-2155(+)